MGDPFTLVTGIAGLLSLGMEVTKITRQYVKGVRNASKDVEEFLDELAALIDVLGRLDDFLKDDKASRFIFDRSSVLFLTYSACEKKLNTVRVQLLKRRNKYTLIKALMWPFVKQEHKETVLALHRWVQTFQLALTVDGCELLSRAAGDVAAILRSQLQTLDETRVISRAVPALQQVTEEASKSIQAVLESIQTYSAASEDIFYIKENVQALKRLALDDQIQRTHKANDSKNEALLEWLSPLDLRAKQADIFGRRSPSTGDWLIENVEFINWVHAIGPSCFWCSGIHPQAGAGKTILTSIVVNHLQLNPPDTATAIAFVYFDYKAKNTQNVQAVFCNLLRQLLEQSNAIPQEVCDLHELLASKRKDNDMSVAQCLSFMQSVRKQFDTVFLLFDAVDECPMHDENVNEIRSQMLSAIQKASKFARVFITSRPHVNMTQDLGDCTCLEVKANDNDVCAYLKSRTAEHRILRGLIVQYPNLERDLIATICTKASGMFLLARLQMDSLLSQTSARSIYRALERLPGELSETYDDAMSRTATQPREYAILAAQVLSWIFYAKRPLSVPELREALSIELGETRLDRSGCPEAELLLDVCCGLVSVDGQDNVIRLVHYSLQQYLEENWKNDVPRARWGVAATCLTYLMLDDFSPEAVECRETQMQTQYRSSSLPTRSQWQQSHKFFSYAASYWGEHVRGRLEIELEALILQFFDQKMHLLYSLQEYNKLIYRNVEYDTWPHEPSPLHITAYWGLSHITEKLIERGENVHAEDHNKRTPLICAAMNGHGDVAYVLLDKGANINTRDVSAATPLHAAVSNDHVDVARLFLLRGIDANVQDSEGYSPMYLAASNGNLAMMDLMLLRGARADKLENSRLSPLEIASRSGHSAAVLWLLMKGVEVNINNGFALVEAIHAKQPHIVRILLEVGAHVNVVSEIGDTALGAAVKQGNLNIAQRLIAAGADVNACVSSVEKVTPLQIAALQGDQDLVNVLIHEGADVRAQGGDVGTVLQNAIYSQNLKVTELILDRLDPSDVNIGKGIFGSTPLQLAVLLKDEEILSRLLRHRSNPKEHKSAVDPNTFTSFGITPLHQALYLGWYSGAEALLKAGANPRLSDLYHQTCLEYTFHDVSFFRKLGGRKKDRNINIVAQKSMTLKTSVRNIVSALLQNPDRKEGHRIDYHYLGHCLLRLADAEEAMTSFEQQIKNPFSKHEPAHNIQCHACSDDQIVGARFVCHACPDIDLCAAHMNIYVSSPPDTVCKGHRFLEVPGPGWQYFGNAKVNQKVETVDEWLRRLLSKYQHTK